jgi:CheY-like chemotaxis protein
MMTGVTKAFGNPYVLLVDDHETCLETLRAVIESAGHRCVAVRSGAEALIYSDDLKPEAVVTDLAMPGINGWVLAHWVKARYPGVPVVVVTGQDPSDPDVVRLGDSVDAVLAKPIDPERLLTLLPVG